MEYPGLDDVYFQGSIASEFATRSVKDWQPRVTIAQREELVRSQATLAAHLAHQYVNKGSRQ